MPIPQNIIANADDFGMTQAINRAILHCYEQGYINSTSLMANMPFFDEAVDLVHKNSSIVNIGVHVNLTDGKPLTNFNLSGYLDEEGNWNLKKVSQKLNLLSPSAQKAFFNEIKAQIEKVLENKVTLVHLDSHRHIHTLPAFYKVFLRTAKTYNLKLRIAQTHYQDSYMNFYYRKYINSVFSKDNFNYSDYFEDAYEFMRSGRFRDGGFKTEIMLHPYFNQSGELSDHLNENAFKFWIVFLKSKLSKYSDFRR